MIVLRALLFNALFYAWTLALVLWAIATTIGQPERFGRLVRLWTRSSLWLLARICRLTHELRGIERLPQRPFIIAAKHQSAWDILALLDSFPDAAFVLKQELRRIPLFGLLTQRAGHIAVDRRAGAKALLLMVAAAREEAKRGRAILVFPQGTRTMPGEARPYQVGIAGLYAELGLPVVPVALNSGLFWPRRRPIQKPGVILVEILPLIAPGLEKRQFLALLAETIETANARLEAESIAQR